MQFLKIETTNHYHVGMAHNDDFKPIMLVFWTNRVSYGWWEATTDKMAIF
jgi:hypothetical protein